MPNKSDPDTYEDKFEPKSDAEVKDKLGNLVYRRGENDQERQAREIEQWLRKVKCTGGGGSRLEQYKDLKIGPYPTPVVYGSPSVEPYPKLRDEVFKFKVNKDDDTCSTVDSA